MPRNNNVIPTYAKIWPQWWQRGGGKVRSEGTKRKVIVQKVMREFTKSIIVIPALRCMLNTYSTQHAVFIVRGHSSEHCTSAHKRN